jgi:hypothetical protein
VHDPLINWRLLNATEAATEAALARDTDGTAAAAAGGAGGAAGAAAGAGAPGGVILASAQPVSTGVVGGRARHLKHGCFFWVVRRKAGWRDGCQTSEGVCLMGDRKTLYLFETSRV